MELHSQKIRVLATDKSEIKKNRTGAGSFEIGNRMEAGGSLQTTDHD